VYSVLIDVWSEHSICGENRVVVDMWMDGSILHTKVPQGGYVW